jgi:YD repeat-containing protein
MIEPNLGNWIYVYGSLRALLEQESPEEREAQTKTVMTYDKLGRMLTRSDADGSSTWIYDTSPGGKGIGKLWKVARAGGDFEREHLYDDKGRPSEVRTTIEAETFSIQTEYETTTSRVKKVIYPGGTFAVTHGYTTWGYLKEVKDATSGALYWKGETADAEGNFRLESYGNGAQTARDYHPQSGMLSSISTGKAGAPPLQELRYDFDWLGNLLWREDRRTVGSFLRETFVNDTLNRLTGSELKQGSTVVDTGSFTYDAIGNLKTKSDVGTYTYGGPRPHAVTNIEGPNAGDYYGTYEYDLNGNMTWGAGRTITWTAFNNAASITKGGIETTFAYDPDRARIKAHTDDGGFGETVLYVSSLFEGRLSSHIGLEIRLCCS